MNLNLTRRESPRFIDAIGFIENQIRSGIKLGLENTLRLLDAVGNPHHGMRFVHVAGTNGKGSVCTLVSSALTECGLKTGTFCSPHLVNIRERYRIDRKTISEEEFADVIEEMRTKAGHLFAEEESPSFFEMTTVLGMMYFKRMGCDVAVLEVGMGGRLDATNVISPLLTVITRLDLDHQKNLGDTIYEIAGEKAGILKPQVTCIVAPQADDAMRRIREIAEERGCPLVVADTDFRALEYEPVLEPPRQSNRVEFGSSRVTIEHRLLGKHQLENTAVAWAAVQTLCQMGLPIDHESAIRGMGRVKWPARFDQQPDGVLIDGAHNEAGIRCLATALDTYFPGRKWHILFSALSSKNWQKMLDIIAAYAHSITVTTFEHRKALEVDEQLIYLRERHPELPVNSVQHAADALSDLRAQDNALVCGSLYMSGEVLAQYTQGGPVELEID